MHARSHGFIGFIEKRAGLRMALCSGGLHESQALAALAVVLARVVRLCTMFIVLLCLCYALCCVVHAVWCARAVCGPSGYAVVCVVAAPGVCGDGDSCG